MTTYQDNAAIIEREEVLQGEGSRVIDVDFSKTDTSSVKSVPLYGEPGFEEYARSLDTRSIGYRVIKRSFDLVFSCIVIVLAFIPLLILSIFIAIDTKAFPVYSHERIGHRGAFNFYKLRSMVKDSDDVEKHFTPEQLEQWNKEHKVDDDPRIASRIIDATARRSSFGPAVASVFPPKMTEISAVFSQVKQAICNLRNLLKNSFKNLLTHTPATTNFFAERNSAPISWGGGLPMPCHCESMAA